MVLLGMVAVLCGQALIEESLTVALEPQQVTHRYQQVCRQGQGILDLGAEQQASSY